MALRDGIRLGNIETNVVYFSFSLSFQWVISYLLFFQRTITRVKTIKFRSLFDREKMIQNGKDEISRGYFTAFTLRLTEPPSKLSWETGIQLQGCVSSYRNGFGSAFSLFSEACQLQRVTEIPRGAGILKSRLIDKQNCSYYNLAIWLLGFQLGRDNSLFC